MQGVWPESLVGGYVATSADFDKDFGVGWARFDPRLGSLYAAGVTFRERRNSRWKVWPAVSWVRMCQRHCQLGSCRMWLVIKVEELKHCYIHNVLTSPRLSNSWASENEPTHLGSKEPNKVHIVH